MQTFFDKEAKSRRPTMTASMVAKRLQIESATLSGFVSKDTILLNRQASADQVVRNGPPNIDLESQAQYLLSQEDRKE